MSEVMKPGSRLRAGAAELIVVAAPSEPVDLTCDGQPVVALAGAAPAAAASGSGPALEIGKRYVDDVSGLELLCTRAGTGVLSCDGRELALKAAKPLPASD